MEISELNRLLREYLYVGFLSEQEQKIYDLLIRYEPFISSRLLEQKQNMYQKGRKLHDEYLKQGHNADYEID